MHQQNVHCDLRIVTIYTPTLSHSNKINRNIQLNQIEHYQSIEIRLSNPIESQSRVLIIPLIYGPLSASVYICWCFAPFFQPFSGRLEIGLNRLFSATG